MSSSRPISGVPIPRISLIASFAWNEPTIPASTPSTPPSLHVGARCSGGGSG